MYNASVLAFQAMPLAAIVNQQFFCVHGGLSPELQTIGDLQRVRPGPRSSFGCSGGTTDENWPVVFEKLDRFCEPGSLGMMCDILWSDPAKNWKPGGPPYQVNPTRGCSFIYGCALPRMFDVGTESGWVGMKLSRCSLIGTISN